MFDQIAIHAIATHLLAYDRSHVAVIDTTGSFSPVTLRDVILSKLDPGAGPSTPYVNVRHETEDEALPQKALQALDRVQIMRAFDFDGVFEAVQEVGTAPGSEASTGRGGGPAMRMAVLDGEEGALAEGALDNRQAQHRSTSVNPTLGMMEIPDSEAEDEEDDQEEGANPIRTAGHDDQRKSPHEAAVKAASSEDDGEGGASSVAKIGMIVIDTITNVVSSMVRASQVQGHASLLSFTRNLSGLATDQRICILMLNGSVSVPGARQEPSAVMSPTPPTTKIPHTHLRPRHSSQADTNQVSIFPWPTDKPALGKAFTHCVDTHVFLSKIPSSVLRSPHATRKLLAGTRAESVVEVGAEVRSEAGEIEHTSISSEWDGRRDVSSCEILADRFSTRQGRWCCFSTDGIRLLCPAEKHGQDSSTADAG